MHVLIAVSMALAVIGSTRADPVSFAYNFPAPSLNANQNIVGFGIQAQVLSSAVGRNVVPADPVLGIKVIGNPFGGPPMRVPNTIDGVDPGTGKNPQFFLAPPTLTIEDRGTNMNTNDRFPGIPNGTTTRIDSVALGWEALNFPPTPVMFGANNQLRFGATLDVARALYQPPNMGIGAPMPKRPAYRDTIMFRGGNWTLDDRTTIPTAQNAQHTIRMGNNAADPNGAVVNGLTFAYTNDAANGITLFDLQFLVSMEQIPLDSSVLSGTFLFDPVVTLDGSLLSDQSSYDVPAGDTIQFLFPETNALYFIAEGQVLANGLVQLGFAYEDQLIAVVPEPATWMLLPLAWLGWIETRRKIFGRCVKFVSARSCSARTASTHTSTRHATENRAIVRATGEM
jgi:hypothetical protein